MPEPQPHARPHLETHSRAKSHSAVAGAAYRLGLRLYDARNHQWCDFRKRALGEEIVLALTVAPEDAPAWATDPSELWNRVEQAEKRKDAQLARDYRIPIPFGLGDGTASALAEEMARFICAQLHTPVSIGVHRDAELDALGVLKPKDKQGFHAHLYFPTRRLADLVGGKDGGGVQGSGFGDKLSMLSNKNTSVAFVENLNERWAALANRYTEAAGLVADYDHRSYERMGLPKVAQLTVGRHVAAMERRGMPTRKGQELREMIARSEIFVAATRAVEETKQARALEKEPSKTQSSAASAQPPELHSAQPPPRYAPQPDWAKASDPILFHKPAKAPRRPHYDGGREHGGAGDGSLVPSAPLHQDSVALGRPSPTPARWEALGFDGPLIPRPKVLVLVVRRAVATYRDLCRAIVRVMGMVERLISGRLDTEHRLTQTRRRREKAYKAKKQWEAKHPLQLNLSSLPGLSRFTGEYREVASQVQEHHQHVQELKRLLAEQRPPIEEAEAELRDLEGQRDSVLEQLRQAACELHGLDEAAFTEFLGTLSPDDQDLVQGLLHADEEAEQDEEAAAEGQVVHDLAPPKPKPKPLAGRGLGH